MNEKDKQIIHELKQRLPEEILAHLKRLIVFGSRASGNALEDSDLDVLALVDEKNPRIEEYFDDIAYQVMWDHDFRPIISIKVLADSHFTNALKKGFSFYRNIDKEGVSA